MKVTGMKTMTGTVLLCFLLAPAAVRAWPLDHLEPWAAVDDYRKDVAKKFKGAFASNMRLLATVEAPMDKDVALGMKVEGERYSIVGWAVNHGKSGHTNCEAKIASATGEKVDRAWQQMIDGAKPDEVETVGADGIFFFFSRNYGGKLSVAEAWTPQDGFKPAALVDLMSSMSRYCLKPGKSMLDRIDRQAGDLIADTQPPP